MSSESRLCPTGFSGFAIDSRGSRGGLMYSGEGGPQGALGPPTRREESFSSINKTNVQPEGSGGSFTSNKGGSNVKFSL